MATTRDRHLRDLAAAEAAYLRLDAADPDALDAAIRAATKAGLTSRDIHEALRAVGGS